MIYADYAATTPLDPRVAAEMAPYPIERFYNPSSLYPEARAVKTELERARARVASCIGAAPEDLIFTSGGTESDNLALLGTALHPGHTRRHIITSAVEHHAVLESCRWLESQGWRVTYLPVDRYGRVLPDTLERALDDDTLLVSIMWVNNELGTVQDVAALAGLAHSRGALFHTDGVQAMTTQVVDVVRADVDLLTLSSHKFYGPKGCGALYVKPGVPLVPLLHGGQQEGFRRGGTENVAAIIGMGAAAELLIREREEQTAAMTRWKTRLIDAFSGMDGVLLNSPPEVCAPSVLHLAFRDVEAEGLLFWLAREGVQVSMGSACNTESVEPSHVVRAIGLPEEYARGCIRLSLGHGLDDAQIDALAQKIFSTVARLRGSAQ